MKRTTLSLRRRHILMAGLAGTAGAALPGALFAAAPGAAHAGKLYLSGRIVTAEGKPVAGASIEVFCDGGTRTSALTDGDGRFLATTDDAVQPQHLHYRVLRGHEATPVMPLRTTATRDESGAWRASFGATLG